MKPRFAFPPSSAPVFSLTLALVPGPAGAFGGGEPASLREQAPETGEGVAATEPAARDRIRVRALGAVVLEVADAAGRVAGCGFDALGADTIPDSDCETESVEEAPCSGILAVLAELPAGRYEVRVNGVLPAAETLAYLELVEVTAGAASRYLGYRLPLPDGGRATLAYEPGATPIATIRVEGREVAEARVDLELDQARLRADTLPSPDLEALCATLPPEREPSEEELYERLRRLLPPGVGEAMRREATQRAFLDAVREGRIEEADELLAEGADVNGAVDGRGPALFVAASAGNRELVELLVAAGADVRRRRGRGETALLLAYRNDRLAVAELLLERGAEPEGRLLLRAVEDGREVWSALLRRFGATVEARALLGLMRRALEGAPDDPRTGALANRALDLLFAEEAWRAIEWDLLSLTVCLPDPSLARRLLDEGADLDLRGGPTGSPPDGHRTLLHAAVASDRPQCVDRLLAWGATVDSAPRSGVTPLMTTMHSQNLPLARRLLRAGASANARTAAGGTPLLLLAASPEPRSPQRRERSIETQRALADLLIEAGADLDAEDESGVNGLLAAAQQGKLWLVEHLLDEGATLSTRTWEAMAALHEDEWRLRLERLWRERDLPVPSLLELFPPQPAPTADARVQLRTMRDLRLVAQALLTWLTDQVGAAAAVQTPSAVHSYRLVSVRELEEMLTPHYLQWIPREDGWGHPIEFRVNRSDEALAGSAFFLLRSPGRDGRFSTDEYRPGAFPPDSYDEDIVLADGRFVRWPQESESANGSPAAPRPAARAAVAARSKARRSPSALAAGALSAAPPPAGTRRAGSSRARGR